MWIVIPPVVANVVANAAYFAFFSYSHYLQVDQELVDLTKSDRRSVNQIIYPDLSEDPGAFGTEAQDMTFLEHREAEIKMDEIFRHFFRVQDELDESCKQWSPLVAAFCLW